MNDYITKPTVKERGWTDAAIKKFLLKADREVPNPHSRSAAPMKLYLKSRVEAVENDSVFIEYKKLIEKRKEQAKRGIETKRQKVIEWVNGLDIDIPTYDKDVLIAEACASFNNWKAFQKEKYLEWESRHWNEAHEYGDDYEPDFSLATPQSNPSFLARITTNYLRHQCTFYERKLNDLFGKVGKDDGHDILQERINQAIHAKYPWTNFVREPQEY